MSSLKLHIVAFDNPYPPNYGGVIDVFYKLKHLHAAGVKIYLHAFEYGRKPARELNQFCEKVFYYQRRNFVNPFIGSLPYIVNTRNSEELLQNLGKDHHPILFEGLHTCYFLTHPKIASRKKIVRMHNIEHEYYEKLEEVERNFFKKYFFSKESQRLKEFEQTLATADLILAISPNDETYLKSKFQHTRYLPAFHPNDAVTSISGAGRYILYHGKLSVGENDEAAKFLVEHVLSKLDIPFYIVGDKPSAMLKALAEQHSHIKIFDHLSTEQISELIQQAHINILPTFQNTGIKLKLINVLFQGRFVLANQLMVANTGLESLCTVANTADEMVRQIKVLMKQEFTPAMIASRVQKLDEMFNNTHNAVSLKALI
ncbi:MAG: glycosyltransferase family 1 protein [Bacteroidota bacterium]